ncbi:hypothetical protein LOK49_LG06G00880 [Camellia lanceoleosa]|uniref:Uncharacterized protein n=1 Tax=Camellia lanceoleosa TaxID=1840588 RepID=A0ACC0HF75_9ERIC|nr:hypothetical protein LOK49_LG06G00880 [Camellia lanceoleosa]
MSDTGGKSGGSRWKRYCERKKQEALAMSSKRKCGVTMAGRVLFKQSNVVRKSPRKAVKTRLNFRSNVAGIIKLVYAVNLREVHLAHLRTTPFWIMFEVILSNQLDHTEFRKGDDLIVRIVKSYNVREGKFVLGGRGVDLTVDDVKLLFGLQGGSAFLDMTPRPRPASDFVQRRCPGTSRITAKLVRDLLMDASVGDTPLITEELVIQAHENAILEGRGLRGGLNVGLVDDDVVEEAGVAVRGFARVKIEGRSYGKQCEGGVQNEPWSPAYVVRKSERGGVSGEGVEGQDGEFIDPCSSPKGHNSSENLGADSPCIRICDAGDSKIVMELRQEVERLNKKLEMQSVNLVEGFESIFKVKDEECKKLVAENAELRRSLAALEEQAAEQAVHNVTQHFASVNVRKTSVDDYGLGNQVEVENGRDNCPTVEGGTMVESSPVAYVTLVDNNEMHCPIQADDSEVVVESPMITAGCSVVEGVNSFVRNIKGKVRKNLKLSGYEYPELKRRGRTIKNKVSVSKPVGVGSSVNVLHRECVVDVENVVDEKKIFSGFGITNRNTVWKMMSEREKEVISSAYERYGDRAVMWVGRDDGNAVYFSDVRSLVRQLGVRGNVIDAYAEVLSDDQETLNAGKDFPENSYFFSSICWDVLKGDNEQAKFNYVKSNIHAAMGARYMHFPICHLGHWTLLVYDTEDGSWKHYNSMRSRSGTGGVHYAEAVKLKNIVTDIQRQAMAANGLDEVVGTQDFDMMVESVAECPQQRAEMMDCAIIVCAVMRQYVNHIDVGRSLDGGNCSVLRAEMVRKFVGDPVRGVMSNMGRMVG